MCRIGSMCIRRLAPQRASAHACVASVGLCSVAIRVSLQPDLSEDEMPRLTHNSSGRFESRFLTVSIQRSPAVLLQGMEVLPAHAQRPSRNGAAPDTATRLRAKRRDEK